MTDIFTGEWYPWYPEKALTSEAIDGLTLAEECAYRRALDKSWIKGSIPSDPKDAARVIGKGCTPKMAAKILTLFVPVHGNKKRSVNPPQERIRAEQKEKHKKAVKRAEIAATKRWTEANKNGGANATSIPQALLKHAIKNKSIEEEKKEEFKTTHTEHASAKPIDQLADNAFLKLYFQAFPEQRLNIFQQEMIADRIQDKSRWTEALKFWKANGHIARNIGNICDYYDELAIKKNGHSKKTSATQRRGKPSNESTDEYLRSIGANPLS